MIHWPHISGYILTNTTTIQVGFLAGICVPCYTLLSAMVPSTQPMLDQCRDNLHTWRQLADTKKREMEAK